MDDDVLKQAMGLMLEGNKKSASELLAGIVRTEPTNEMAWLYLSYCVGASDQKAYCLRKTLEINPNNQQARQALLEMTVGGQPSNVANVSEHPPMQEQLAPHQYYALKDEIAEGVSKSLKEKEAGYWRNILIAFLILLVPLLCLFVFVLIRQI